MIILVFKKFMVGIIIIVIGRVKFKIEYVDVKVIYVEFELFGDD